jgi:hypothetical protein
MSKGADDICTQWQICAMPAWREASTSEFQMTPLDQVIAAITRERSRYVVHGDKYRYFTRSIEIIECYRQHELEFELGMYAMGFKDALKVKESEEVAKTKDATVK